MSNSRASYIQERRTVCFPVSCKNYSRSTSPRLVVRRTDAYVNMFAIAFDRTRIRRWFPPAEMLIWCYCAVASLYRRHTHLLAHLLSAVRCTSSTSSNREYAKFLNSSSYTTTSYDVAHIYERRRQNNTRLSTITNLAILAAKISYDFEASSSPPQKPQSLSCINVPDDDRKHTQVYTNFFTVCAAECDPMWLSRTPIDSRTSADRKSYTKTHIRLSDLAQVYGNACIGSRRRRLFVLEAPRCGNPVHSLCKRIRICMQSYLFMNCGVHRNKIALWR